MRSPRMITLSALFLVWLGGGACTSGVALDPSNPNPDGEVEVTSIVVSPRRDTLLVGSTTRLRAEVIMAALADIPAVSWSSSEPTVVRVTSEGEVTALKSGTTHVRASVGTKSDSAVILVQAAPSEPPPPPTVASVVVSPATGSVDVGAAVQLQASARADDGTALNGFTFSWSTSDASAATVSSTGRVTGVKAGTVQISASTGGKTGSATITINAVAPPPPAVVASVEITPASTSVSVGVTSQLTAVTKDAQGGVITGRTITWSSSNTSVASVSANGIVTGVTAGSATITATSEGRSGTATVFVGTRPAPAPIGIWISKAELDALPMSGPAWSGTGELKHTADAAWTVQNIEVQDGQFFNVQAMAGALVFARMYPDPAAETYRMKVAQAIRDEIGLPDNLGSSATAPNRNLGVWAINADLINLAQYDPALDARFRAWLIHKLDLVYGSSPKTIRLQAMIRPNNQGSWASFALGAVSRYLGDRATLDKLAIRQRRYFGDLSAPHTSFVWRPVAENSFQMNPAAPSTWVGIIPKGAVRDGHNFDGLQPEDQGRGNPVEYNPADFPNNYSSVRYNEVSTEALMGAVIILHRAGHTDLLDVQDRALLRAIRWVKYAADTFPGKGYQYYVGFHEASRPLVNYLYSAGLPEARTRTQLGGKAFGFAWTYWTHAGRTIR